MRPSSLSRRAACSVMRACAPRILGRQRRGCRGERGAARAGRACSGCRPLPLAGVQRRQMSGALRNVPSPEQGTSQSTRSKRTASPCGARCRGRRRAGRTGAPARPGGGTRAWASRMAGKTVASWLVTTSAGLVMRLVWCVSRWQRCASASLATMRPARAARARVRLRGAAGRSGPGEGGPGAAPEGSASLWCSISRICTVLEPGEAHVSSTCAARSRGGPATREAGVGQAPAAGAPGARAARPAAAPAPWTRPGNAGRG
jgi:hypothetical protein